MRHQECHHDAPDPQLTFEHLITQLQAAVSQSINGVTLRGSLPIPIASASQGTIKPQGAGTHGRLMGLEVRESSTTNPILVRVFDGELANGVLLATVPLAAGQGVARNYPGLSYINGLTVVLSALDGASPPAGTCEGIIWIGAAAEGS